MIALLIALLGRFTKLPAWAQHAAELALVAGLVWFSLQYAHAVGHREGYAAALADVQKAADKDHAAQQANATHAETAHEATTQALDTYRSANPVPSVKLCVQPAMPQGTVAGRSGRAGTQPAAGDLQSVPAGNIGSGPSAAGPDIAGLLDALAARADQVTADRTELRAIVIPLTH